MAKEDAQETYEAVQEGSRWIGNPPSPEQFADWFVANVPVHEKLKERAPLYAGGVTLISATEDIKRTNAAGDIEEAKRLVFIPYAKVETRVAYFHDLCEVMGWRGEIVPDDIKRIPVDQVGVASEHLPPGFFRMPVGTPDGKQAHFLCCSMVVRAYSRPDAPPSNHEEAAALAEQQRRHPRAHSEQLVFAGAPGTKQVALIDRFDKVDANAIMKAQTGAVGRALGFAGMLIIPGSGVASAEDILEARSGDGVGATAELPPVEAGQPTLPEAGQPQTLKERVVAALEALDAHPEQKQKLQAWAQEKRLALTDDLADSQLRTILRKAEQLLGEAGPGERSAT